MTLPATGVLSYNGVIWDFLVKSHIESREILDEAARTSVLIEYTLTVDGYISAGANATSDPAFLNLRKKLLVIGAPLFYQNKGFGDLVVNDPATGIWDCKWGPIPEILSFTPIGNNQSCKVTWKVVTRIPYCAPTARTTKFIYEWNYGVEYDIDGDGYTTIVTNGHIIIPMTRAPGTLVIPDWADYYRERLQSTVPLGFQRKPQRYVLSPDKRRLDFSYTDTEIPVPLPEGVTAANVRHRIETEAPSTDVCWKGSISGSITLAWGQPKALAWDKFQIILARRLPRNKKGAFPTPRSTRLRRQIEEGIRAGKIAGRDFTVRADPNDLLKAENEGIGVPGTVFVKAGKAVTEVPWDSTLLVTNIMFEDDVFGRTSNFSVSYRVLNTSLNAILSFSGFWTRISDEPDSVLFSKWRASLEDTAFHVRGGGKVKGFHTDDVIVDLCSKQVPRQREPGVEPRPDVQRNILNAIPGAIPISKPLPPDLLDAQRGLLNSPPGWIKHANRFEIHRDNRVSAIPAIGLLTNPPPPPPGVLLPTTNTDAAPGLLPLMVGAAPDGDVKGTRNGAVTGDPAAAGAPQGEASPGKRSCIQRRGDPVYRATLSGYAVRIGQRIPIPALESFGGCTPVEMTADTGEEIIAAIGGLPIYFASWVIDYYCSNAPAGNLPVPANHEFGITGTTGNA